MFSVLFLFSAYVRSGSVGSVGVCLGGARGKVHLIVIIIIIGKQHIYSISYCTKLLRNYLRKTHKIFVAGGRVGVEGARRC